MRRFASPAFWEAYRRLPDDVRALADKNYLKKVGPFWSVRVGGRYRALATEIDQGLLWFWIGSHADYDALV